jgi:tetratricopeptide (TPR) repeat protein
VGRSRPSEGELRARLELVSRELPGDKAGALRSLQTLFGITSESGYFKLALDVATTEVLLSREVDSGHLGQALADRGATGMKLGRGHEARRDLREALAAFDAAGDTTGRAELLVLLAERRRRLGNVQSARRLANRALALCEKADDSPCRGDVLCALAEIDVHEGHGHDARVRYVAALAAYQESEDAKGVARVMRGRGELLRTREPGTAEELLRKSMEVYGRDYAGVAEAMLSLGNLLRRQGRYEEADYAFNSAMERFHRLHDHAELARTLIAKAGIGWVWENFDDAKGLVMRANSIAHHATLDRLWLCSAVLQWVADIALQGNRPISPMLALREAEACASKYGDAEQRAAVLRSKAKLLLKNGDPGNATAAIDEALRISLHRDDMPGAALALLEKSLVLERQGDLDAAIRLAEDALQMTKDLWLPSELAARTVLARLLETSDAATVAEHKRRVEEIVQALGVHELAQPRATWNYTPIWDHGYFHLGRFLSCGWGASAC